MAAIVVQPPRQTPLNRALYPPVVARVQFSQGGGRQDNLHVFATAVLLDGTGVPAQTQMRGNPASSGFHVDTEVRQLSDGSQARLESFAFPFADLIPCQAGDYSIQVDIYHVDYSQLREATMVARVETARFHAVNGTVMPEAPSAQEQAMLQHLHDMGSAIPLSPP